MSCIFVKTQLTGQAGDYICDDHRCRADVPSAEAVVAEAFSERVVVDLELGDLLVLVGGHGDERRLVERVRVERVPAHAEDVVRLNDVDAWLVLVHRVQYDLQTTRVVAA